MTDGTNAFIMPREPFLSRKYLRLGSRHSPQESSQNGTTRRFFFWARNALYHALSALEAPRGGRALVPAYICRAAAEPFAAYGLKVDFYGVRRDCSVDFEDLESRIRDDTRVALAVHYFGFPQKMEEFDRIRRARGLLVFEDCAHVLKGGYKGQALGSFGDASVFSYRKHLPMFDGAELLLRKAARPDELRNGTGWRSQFEIRAAKHIVGFWLEGRGKTRTGSGAAVTRRSKNAVDQAAASWGEEIPMERSAHSAVDNNTATFEEDLVNEPITRASRWVLRHSDIEAIARKRLENFLVLRAELEKIDRVKVLFEAASANVCPWVCPILIDGAVDGHLRLREAGIPAVTWGSVRPPSMPFGEHSDAEFLFANCIFLPVHQNLCIEDMRLIAEQVRTVARSVDSSKSASRRCMAE